MKIKLNDIKLFGYHGLNSIEKNDGQNFLISILLLTDINIESIDDDIDNTIDYTIVYKIVKEVFNAKRYNLIESLVNEIKIAIKDNRLLKSNHHKIIDIEVTVSKSGKLFDGDIDSFEIIS